MSCMGAGAVQDDPVSNTRLLCAALHRSLLAMTPARSLPSVQLNITWRVHLRVHVQHSFFELGGSGHALHLAFALSPQGLTGLSDAHVDTLLQQQEQNVSSYILPSVHKCCLLHRTTRTRTALEYHAALVYTG